MRTQQTQFPEIGELPRTLPKTIPSPTRSF